MSERVRNQDTYDNNLADNYRITVKYTLLRMKTSYVAAFDSVFVVAADVSTCHSRGNAGVIHINSNGSVLFCQ